MKGTASARLRMANFTPSTLKAGEEGDPAAFFGKLTGFGYNDMISLPTLTKDSILDNLRRRFKVCCHRHLRHCGWLHNPSVRLDWCLRSPAMVP